MKNLVMVNRLKDNAKRIYELPVGMTLTPGTVLMVEYAGGTALAVAASNNYEVDDNAETMIRDLLHITHYGAYQKVVKVLTENDVWPAEPEDEETDEAEDETAVEADEAEDE